MDDTDLLKYSRHILLPQIDVAGQEKIIAARILILGLGGLGSPVAMYLAASGVGELVLVDDDSVDLSNLQRQIVHSEKTLGMSKVESAELRLNQINKSCNIRKINRRLDEHELVREVQAATAVADCSDNFATRKLINKICFDHKVPLVSGAAIRMEGQITVFDFSDPASPCYQCLYDIDVDENLNCSESGVLAPLVGVIGSFQAVETLKIITGFGKTLSGRLALFDAELGEWRHLVFKRDPHCPVCGSP